MDKIINVAVLGYGFASKVFHAPLIAGVPGLRLAAISSSDAAKVAADWPGVPVVPSPEAVFADPHIDLVVIPTPNPTHAPLARAALEAGKHVVVDKPFTIHLAEARALHALAERSGRVLSVFQNRRWDADFLTLRQVIARGELGRIVHFESHFDRYRPYLRNAWRETNAPGIGLWYDLGAHLADQALQLFGTPDSITLDMAAQRDGSAVCDWFHAILRYGTLRCVLHASTITAQPAPRFMVHGTQGSFVKWGLDPQEDALKAGSRPPLADWGNDPLAAQLTTCPDGTPQMREIACQAGDYPAYYAAVRDAILGRGPNPVDARQGVRVMGLLELGVRSHAEGRTLAINEADLAP